MTAAAMPDAPRKPLVPCCVRISRPGRTSQYEGLFRSTCDAVIDAIDRFPEAQSISVLRLNPPAYFPNPYHIEVTP